MPKGSIAFRRKTHRLCVAANSAR